MPGKHTTLLHKIRLMLTSLMALSTVLLFQMAAGHGCPADPANGDRR